MYQSHSFSLNNVAIESYISFYYSYSNRCL